ncbi:aspartyl aminopeptidase [Purpureocillium lavendulum]|uniref:Aspartyl aminopeptidase n=1 Tax=Purpureocillium lavendulum TaxID=1247861 RepID=A0AB34FJJ2_9HYPO|nr:aspartyl aminopeptidase [Purpureocillium lavendulum]
MKFSGLLVGTATALAGTSIAHPTAPAPAPAAGAVDHAPAHNTSDYVRLALDEPLNWLPGARLFPGAVIAAYHADLAAYDAESWAQSVLERCASYEACTSTASYSGEFSFFSLVVTRIVNSEQWGGANERVLVCVCVLAINSGSTGGRYWFGTVFRGGPTTEADYVRSEGVEHSIVYTIKGQ